MVERFRVETTSMARRDIDDIVVWSWREFGEAAAYRYEDLLEQALTDLGSGPSLAAVSFAQTSPTASGSITFVTVGIGSSPGMAALGGLAISWSFGSRAKN